MDINKVFVIGRLTKDPELTYTSSGSSVCKFGLAINEHYGEKDIAYFFDCVAWGKTAETISKYCKKGNRVALDGRLVQNRWTNNEGQARSKAEINVGTIQFLEKKSE